MKFLKQFIIAAVAASVLAVGALGVEPQKNNDPKPPPKEDKQVPKPPKDRRALHGVAEIRLSRQLQRHRPEHPDDHQPDERADDHPGTGVELPNLVRLSAANGRSNRAADDLEGDCQGDGPREGEHRRVRRLRAARKQHRRQTPTDDRADEEAGERKAAPDEAL